MFKFKILKINKIKKINVNWSKKITLNIHLKQMNKIISIK